MCLLVRRADWDAVIRQEVHKSLLRGQLDKFKYLLLKPGYEEYLPFDADLVHVISFGLSPNTSFN